MRIVIVLLLIVGALAGAFFGLNFAYERTFYPTPPVANYPAPKDLTEAQSQDIAYARNVLTLDRSWTDETHAKAEAKFAELEKRAGQMTPVEFSFALGEIVSLADNGHSSVQSRTRNIATNRIPVRFFPFESGMYVVRTDGANTDLLGAKLVRIEETPAEAILTRSHDFYGGLSRSREMSAPSIAESPEQLNALSYAAKPESALYVLAKPDGTEVQREIVGEPASEKRVRAYLDRWMSPEPIKDEAPGWSAWITADRNPLAFQEPDLPYRAKRLPELDAVFVQFRENDDFEEYKIKDFIKQAEAEIAAARPKNVILDMRQNGGGDYTTTIAFMKELPGLVPGKVFALTSPLTFSAGISSIAFLEATAPDRVIIVGEPVGDRLIAYGEGGVMTLPNSKITIRFATGLHDYEHGCKWFGPCFWVNYVYPVSVPTLAPDITAPLDGPALAEGRDPALEAIAAELAFSKR